MLLRLLLSLLAGLVCSGIAVASSPTPPYRVVQTLTRPDGGAFDNFGFSVDVDDRHLIAGAFNVKAEDGSHVGAAYIYQQADTGLWQPAVELMADDGQHNDSFGWSVAISGDNALVSAVHTGDYRSTTQGRGTVYFFSQTSEHSWDQVGRFVPPVGVDNFGLHLGLEGALAAVAGIERVDVGPGPSVPKGFVQVFRETDSGWRHYQQLNVGGPATGVNDLSLSDGRLAIGVSRWLSDDSPQLHEVQIYEDIQGSFQRVSTIASPNVEGDDRFGWSVSLDGDQLLIGASTEAVHGAAYIYENAGGPDWNQVARLVASDATERYHFGSEVALEGDLALVNSWVGPGNISDGVVYVFEQNAGQWGQADRLESDFGSFGRDLSVSGGLSFIGSGVNAPGAIDVVARVPEPAAWLLMLHGYAAMSFYRRMNSGP